MPKHLLEFTSELACSFSFLFVFLSLISGKEDNGGIKRALLEVIASGVVTRPQDVERYSACTFFASVPARQDVNDTDAVIKKTVKFLVENEFVRLQRCDDTKTEENNDETEEVRLKRIILN